MILEDALRQAPIEDLTFRSSLNLYYTQSRMAHFHSRVLRPFEISNQQFNILRILKGQNGKPIVVGDISNRMVDKMSNTSRLVEKMRLKSLVERTECPHDRRKVELMLTDKGLDLVKNASETMSQEIRKRMSKLDDQELVELNRILDKLNG
jgi:DNA-binding MarR family transcriptional regulator